MRMLLVAVVIMLASGCNGGLNTARVTGKVTLDGQPVEGAKVQFQPTETMNQQSPVSHGVTDSHGEYSLTVTATGQSGAIIGKHRVSITKFEGGSEDPQMDVSVEGSEPKNVIPAKYNQKKRTHL